MSSEQQLDSEGKQTGTRKEHSTRSRGPSILARFTGSMFVALTLMLGIAAAVLYGAVSALTQSVQHATIQATVALTDERPPFDYEGLPQRNVALGVESQRINYGHLRDMQGWEYRVTESDTGETTESLLLPGKVGSGEDDLLGLISALFVVVIGVGTGISMWASRRVARPIERVIDDIREVARGDLRQLSNVKGTRETDVLVRAINRMTVELEAAQEAEMELAVREREMELAGGVREALLPVTTPLIDGFDIGSSHLSSTGFGGDFHDYIELADGRIGMLACDVAGTGVPAALVGSTARSYLRSHLMQGGSLEEALCRVNRELARDVRRGMFVTVLYALLDPTTARVQVACAGHKLPLVRFTAADGKLRLLHPEGIALGFDKGPVFERALQLLELEMEPGDRLLIANSGPVRIQNDEGRELGERSFYSQVLKGSTQETGPFLKGLRRFLEGYAGDSGLSVDISLVTVLRAATS